MTKSNQIREKIEIVKYKTIWKSQFQLAMKSLTKHLGDLVIDIQHIGSTSIEGLAAKDRIDIQVSVKEINEDLCLEINKRLADFSFPEAFMSKDHLPPWDNNEDNWKKIYLQGVTSHWDFKCNIHIRKKGAANHDYALLFRDYLRNDEECRTAYKNFKETLAEHLPNDRDAYSDFKDPFCDMIMINARRWANESNWKAY